VPTEPVVVPVKSELRPEEIQAEVRGAFGRFRTCYEALLTRSPGSAGRSTLAFAIEADGRVSDLAVDEASTLREPTMDACMLSAFSQLRFPPSKGRVTVKYPVAFAP
jgi:hypothetical protein